MAEPDEVVVRCHCGKLKVTVQLRDPLPYQDTICHCNICRHVTGALTFTGTLLLNPPVEDFKRELKKYATSQEIWRYSCSTCGSQPVYYVVSSDQWGVCSGAIDEVKKGKKGTLEQLTGHKFVGDTKDGGLSRCLPSLPYYVNNDDEPPVENIKASLAEMQSEQPMAEKLLRAECHCGNTKLLISRPQTGGKWKGVVCCCRSCRLSFSQTFVSWFANIPYSAITWHNGDAFDNGVREGITRFKSSDHAHRDFCANCAATILWSSAKEPGTVDIAAGILRANSGALARDWINWRTDKVYHSEEALDQELISKFELARLIDTEEV